MAMNEELNPSPRLMARPHAFGLQNVVREVDVHKVDNGIPRCLIGLWRHYIKKIQSGNSKSSWPELRVLHCTLDDQDGFHQRQKYRLTPQSTHSVLSSNHCFNA